MGTFTRTIDGREYTYLDKPHWRVSFRTHAGRKHTVWASCRVVTTVAGRPALRYIECTQRGESFDGQIRVSLCDVDDVISEQAAWLNLHYGELELFERDLVAKVGTWALGRYQSRGDIQPGARVSLRALPPASDPRCATWTPVVIDRVEPWGIAVSLA